MRVIHKLGPADHGRTLEYDDFMAAEYAPGFKYEIIDGSLYVSPAANPPQDRLDTWLFGKMFLYSQEHPESVNYVTNKARVFVPGRSGTTAPEPGLAVYRDYPLELPLEELDWEKLRPIVVAEVISPGDPKKDLVRNVELYLQVLSIREYWVLDGRDDADRPTMLIFRKRGSKWTKIEVPFGETYTTKLLPGFALKIDPRS